MRLPPADIGRIGFAIGHLVDGSAPAVEGLAEQAAAFAGATASALEQAERPLIISGVNCRSAPVLKAAANVAWALRGKGKNASLCLVMPECNSFGLALLSDRGLDAAFEDAQAGDDIAIVLENDLYRRLQIDKADDFLAAFRRVVVIDHLFHRTALGADMRPAGSDLRRRGRDIRQQRRPGSALFPGISAGRPHPAGLAMAYGSHGAAGTSGRKDMAQPRRPHRLHGQSGPPAGRGR